MSVCRKRVAVVPSVGPRTDEGWVSESQFSLLPASPVAPQVMTSDSSSDVPPPARLHNVSFVSCRVKGRIDVKRQKSSQRVWLQPQTFRFENMLHVINTFIMKEGVRASCCVSREKTLSTKLHIEISFYLGLVITRLTTDHPDHVAHIGLAIGGTQVCPTNDL